MIRYLWAAQAALRTMGAVMDTLGRQRLGPVRPVAAVLLALALLFSFLAAARYLSPFIYPLF